MAGEMTLYAWLHPTMQIPFKFVGRQHPFQVSPDSLIVDLMDECEQVFEEVSNQAGSNLELQINVLWNVKDHKKALNPQERIGRCFVSGDTFGVYGDVQEAPPQPPCKFKPEEEKTPVTILTGFLGSGKTTLLNYLLKEQRDMKIAIIENEFGEISIDDALLKQDKLAMAEKIVVMDNGCVCCTIRGDLVKGLKSILDDMDNGSNIDAIILETTGMADPVPIVRTFMSNPELTEDLRLDAVIALADAKNILGRLDDDIQEGRVNEAYQQLAFADKIILNKLDLITTEQAIGVKDRIREINKFAKILPAVRGRVKVSELTNIRAHDMANFVNEDIEKDADVAPELGGHGGGGHGGGGHGDFEEEQHGGGHGGGDAHGGAQSSAHGGGHGGGHGGAGAGHGPGRGHGASSSNRHDARVNSFAVVREGEILPMKLSRWMASLSQLPPEMGIIFRIKAILAVKGHPYKHVFHAVMDVSDEDDAAPWGPDEKRISKIVFIGKAMDQKFLRQGFEAIFE